MKELTTQEITKPIISCFENLAADIFYLKP